MESPPSSFPACPFKRILGHFASNATHCIRDQPTCSRTKDFADGEHRTAEFPGTADQMKMESATTNVAAPLSWHKGMSWVIFGGFATVPRLPFLVTAT
jgi:hypothetical protein